MGFVCVPFICILDGEIIKTITLITYTRSAILKSLWFPRFKDPFQSILIRDQKKHNDGFRMLLSSF